MGVSSAAPTRGATETEERTGGQGQRSLHRPDLRTLSLTAAGALLDAVSSGVRRLPQRARYALSDGMIVALRPLLRRPRTSAAANFARLVGEDHPRLARALADRALRNYGRMAMDFLAARTMAPDEILRFARPVGADNFHEVVARGRGAIFALPHAGSWDVAAVFAQAYGCKLTVVTESNWVTELVAGSRRRHGVTLAPRGRSLRPLFRALRHNECVVMLADMVPSGVQAAPVPFFGAPASFPLGPARLALATGAPILVIASVRESDGTYRVEAQAPLYPDAAQPTDEAALALTAAIAAGFERIIAEYPDQWYPFHPVWDDATATATQTTTAPGTPVSAA